MLSKDKSYYMQKGDKRYRRKCYKMAVMSYSKAIELSGDDQSWPLFKRGQSFAKINYVYKAIADYTTALKINPDDETIKRALYEINDERQRILTGQTRCVLPDWGNSNNCAEYAELKLNGCEGCPFIDAVRTQL